MKIKKTKLKGVYKIEISKFVDFRGEYIESFNLKKFLKFKKIKFLQDDFSISKKNVLRGFHGDSKTWKLVSCVHGSFDLVVINYNRLSKQYLKTVKFKLSDKKYEQILIPPKFGNAHLVKSKKAIFHYKQSTYYNRTGQFTIKWNDPRLKLKWSIKKPILSKRDK
tara:strand:- start:1647 stop:2141 length:495 start_codon:yes stop_codon:yes gene_type:complete